MPGGEGVFVVLMLASIAFNYGAGIWLGRGARSIALEDATGRIRSRLLVAVFGNLILLGWFKYAGFLAGLLSALLGPALMATGFSSDPFASLSLESVHLPIGISFFTFQAISYLIDVDRGAHPPQRNPIDLALFIALFPQLIAGPIVRYKDLANQLVARGVSVEDAAEGVRRFTIGLSKKVLVANSLGIPADAIFALPANELTSSVAWFGLLCYALQIFFDFSGYSDMAIGLGRLFGFRLPENFDGPYRSRSVTEFWRRWHLSLSNWFRDYLYIPLGGNRRGSARTYFNLMVVFLLCGLWHGASINFVVWGALHGGFLIAERAGGRRVLDSLPVLLSRIYCLLAVGLAWVFFRADSLADATAYLSSLAGLGSSTASALIVDYASIESLVALGVGILWAAQNPVRFSEFVRRPFGRHREDLSSGWSRIVSGVEIVAPSTALVSLWLLCGMKLASRTYDPFLYSGSKP